MSKAASLEWAADEGRWERWREYIRSLPVHDEPVNDFFLLQGATRTSSWYTTAAESQDREGNLDVRVGFDDHAKVSGGMTMDNETTPKNGPIMGIATVESFGPATNFP